MKYRIKTGPEGVRVVDKAVAQVVEVPSNADTDIINNTVDGANNMIKPQVTNKISIKNFILVF